MTCQRPAKQATKQNAAAVKEFQEVTFPKIVEKAKKEGGIILFGDETGICNQENYQRGFSPEGVAPVVKLQQWYCEFMWLRQKNFLDFGQFKSSSR